jgi:hypothetical protein
MTNQQRIDRLRPIAAQGVRVEIALEQILALLDAIDALALVPRVDLGVRLSAQRGVASDLTKLEAMLARDLSPASERPS